MKQLQNLMLFRTHARGELRKVETMAHLVQGVVDYYEFTVAELEEARQLIGAYIVRYNGKWLLERHGYCTAAEVRRALTRQAA